MRPMYSRARAFWRNEDGSILGYLTLVFTAIIGIVALGAEGGEWLYTHRIVQSAADSAAYSAAAAYAADKTSNLTAQARAIAANDYGLVNGTNGVTVTVNSPPSGTCYSGTSHYTGANAIEVVVTQSLTPLLSAIWLTGDKSICGRAVAVLPSDGDCILALGTTGTVISDSRNNLNLNLCGTDSTCSSGSCSVFADSSDANAISLSGNNDALKAASIGTVGGIGLSGNSKTTAFNPATGAPPVADPYASDASSWSQTLPTAPTISCASCSAQTAPTCGNGKNQTTVITLAPGSYAAAVSLDKCTTVTMTAGSYVFAQGLTIPTNATPTVNIGAGSTIIVTTGGFATNKATVNFQGGNNSISILSGGWTSSGSVSFAGGNNVISVQAGGWTSGAVTFSAGNNSIYIKGGWTSNGNLTMAGTASVAVTGDFTLNGTTSTLGAGVYYISGNLNMTGSGGETVTATGVTLVLTGASSVITDTAQNSNLTITAPTASGWNQGIAIWEPNSTGANTIGGNSAAVAINGVVYVPNGSIAYAGNTGATPTCTQIVAKSISFGGNSINITSSCASVPGLKQFGQIPALVE